MTTGNIHVLDTDHALANLLHKPVDYAQANLLMWGLSDTNKHPVTENFSLFMIFFKYQGCCVVTTSISCIKALYVAILQQLTIATVLTGLLDYYKYQH